MSKSKFTPEFKATALATLQANGGNVSRTASLLNLPRKTLESWSKGLGMKAAPIPEGLIEQKASELADNLDKVAALLVNEMNNPEKIAKASLQDVGIALGIAIDKRNLLRHLPTSISERVEVNRRSQYESAVTRFIAECKKRGAEFEVDRTGSGSFSLLNTHC